MTAAAAAEHTGVAAQSNDPLAAVQPQSGDSHANKASSNQQPLVYTHDQLLPPELLQSLQNAFSSSSSDFWQQHNYSAEDTPFFSYLIDLKQAALSGPSNALEAAALLLQQHIKHLAATIAHSTPGTATAAGKAKYVEWWAHTRPMHAPHQLHFDAAELAFR